MKIFITGGSRGIGASIVTTSLKQGHEVAFTYNNPDTDIEAILHKFRKTAPDALCKAYQLDVRDSDKVAEVVDQVVDDFDTIDAVVNNAGIVVAGLTASMSDEDWQSVIDTNLTGAFYVVRQFLPLFLANKKGRFVMMSSVASAGIPGHVSYNVSKAGLVSLSNTIALEYGSKGITSNAILPGVFSGGMTYSSGHMVDTIMKSRLELCAMKRLGKLEELAELVLFLASDKAEFVNGEAINIAGGLMK